MLLTKYCLLVPLPKGMKFFYVQKGKQLEEDLLHAMSGLQDLNLSIDDYCDQIDELETQKQEVVKNAFCHFFMVVPDFWLRSIESRIPLTNSHQVKSLAALALASEVSHLAPNSVCYRYRITSEPNHDWQIEVASAPKRIFDLASGFLQKPLRFKGIIPAQDCLALLADDKVRPNRFTDLEQLSLKPKMKPEPYLKRYAKSWLLLLCLTFMSQLLLLYLYESEKQSLARAELGLQQVKRSTSSLTKVENNESAQVARELLQSLPLDIRVNSIVSENDITRLGVSLSSERLLTIYPLWQSKWKGYQLLLKDEWLQPLTLFSKEMDNQNNRTRSVLNVVIQIQKY